MDYSLCGYVILMGLHPLADAKGDGDSLVKNIAIVNRFEENP